MGYPDPRQAILAFLRSTYAGTAALMGWDRDLTEVASPSAARSTTSAPAEDKA